MASPNPGSVNIFWAATEHGLVVIDAGRSPGETREALASIKRAGKPVVAILITHPHPDHVGGIGVLHDAFPDAPVYASAGTVEFMRTDPLGFYELTRSTPGVDYPAELTIPDQVLPPNKPVDAGGPRLEMLELGQGESTTHTIFYEQKSGALFAGDLVANQATPAMLEGYTCAWLTQLDELRDYLREFRRLVREAIAPASPSGAEVSQDEMTAVIAEMPDYPLVAALPTLAIENVKAVAKELATEQPNCRE